MVFLSKNLQGKSNDRHLYAVGRIRVLETRLLERDLLRSLIEAQSIKDVYNELRDTIYGEAVIETDENLDFERMLKIETTNLIYLMDSICPDPELIDLFVYFFDVQNLKILFKAEMAKAYESHSFYAAARYSVSFLRELVQNTSASQREFPGWMISAARELRDVWKKSQKLRLVDAVWDRALILAQLDGAQRYKRPILAGFFIMNIDIHNVETFIRIRISERSREQFEQFFIPQGHFPLSFFQNAWGAGIREIHRHFEKTPFYPLVDKALEEYHEEGSLTMLEIEESRLLIDQLDSARYVTFGPEPILAYLVTRLFEIKILRRIFVAKKNKLPIEDLRKRVMTYYA
jgi:V/A-type H+-transporting ATPase subunit C